MYTDQHSHPAKTPTPPPAHLDALAGNVPRVGRHEGGEGEAGQRGARKLLQQVARLLQRLELQAVQGVEHLQAGRQGGRKGWVGGWVGGWRWVGGWVGEQVCGGWQVGVRKHQPNTTSQPPSLTSRMGQHDQPPYSANSTCNKPAASTFHNVAYSGCPPAHAPCSRTSPAAPAARAPHSTTPLSTAWQQHPPSRTRHTACGCPPSRVGTCWSARQ